MKAGRNFGKLDPGDLMPSFESSCGGYWVSWISMRNTCRLYWEERRRIESDLHSGPRVVLCHNGDNVRCWRLDCIPWVAVRQPNVEIESVQIVSRKRQFAVLEVGNGSIGQNLPTRRSIKVKNIAISLAHLVEAKMAWSDKTHSLAHHSHGVSTLVPSIGTHTFFKIIYGSNLVRTAQRVLHLVKEMHRVLRES